MRHFLPVVLALVLLASPVTTQQAPLPTPEASLGFRVGADFKLATYEESLEYFRRLDAASDKLTLVEAGATSEGKRWYFALISSPDNLTNLQKYRDIAQRLAHPEGLTDAQARDLARQGKALVHIDGGLHASEVAAAQHTIQLAHDLLAGADDPTTKTILDNVILMLWPSVNPDGQDIVVNWYRGNVGTPYEVAPLVELYQKYVGHDNNRDAYMVNMIESRVISRTWREWEPQIIYVHHQSSPFPTRIWLPPFAEPIAPRVPPLLSRTVNMIGMAIAQGLEQKGMVGATHMGTGFDAWYPGYIDYMPMLQNTASFWTETALYQYATPHYYTLRDFPENMRDLRSQSLYPSPWPGGWWRLRDAVDYMLTASKSVLEYASKYKDDLLYNRYQAGRDVIRKYSNASPYAYFVPQDQRDPLAPVELLRRLAFNGIRVSQLSRAVTAEGTLHPAGTWVVPLNQEFGELARQLLEVQVYPDLREYPEGPPEQPYDAAGWTLPYQMDVRVIEATSPLTPEVRAAMTPLAGQPRDWRKAAADADADDSPFDSVPGVGLDTNAVAAAIVPPPGKLTGAGVAMALDPAQNNAFRAIGAAWKAGGAVRFESAASGAGGQPATSGRYILTGVPQAWQIEWTERLALRAERVAVGGLPLAKPRIGVYHPWTPSMDEGWARWLFDNYGFEYTTVTNAEVKSGALRDRFDVLLIADERPRTILEGFQTGTVPPRFEGGLGDDGVRALDEFVRDGGTLVCLNQSSNFAIEQLHLPVRNVVAELKPQQFFASGSILQISADQAHPVMAGMPARAKVFFDDSPVFTTLDGFKGTAFATYQTSGTPLLSGYLLGEGHLNGYAAGVDVAHGRGHVILIGFRPHWRGQPFGTFRVLFNSMLFHGEVAAKAAGTAGFWAPPEK